MAVEGKFNIPEANPDYGKGYYRRRIALQGYADRVEAALEDTNHGFRSTIWHDGKTVTRVVGENLRTPLDTCGGALEPLKALEGLTLDAGTFTITKAVNPRANCTHLYDLSLLAIKHGLRGETYRQIDVEVSDEHNCPAECKAWIDQRLVHHWQAKDWQVISPEAYAGNPLFKGFSAWANPAFSGDEQDAAFALQKGYFVAQARRWDLDSIAGSPALMDEAMLGACYSFSPGVVEHAKRINSQRDFSDTPEQLLQFVDATR